jgi:hypothetical protein
MPGKRRFGRVRTLPSGRWQARYKGPDGTDRPAPHTFGSKTSAERWLTLTEAEVIRGDWANPDAGRVLFGQYARDWIDERPGLRPKTVQLYATSCGAISARPSRLAPWPTLRSRTCGGGVRTCSMPG